MRMVHHPLCKQLQITRREMRSILSYLRLGPDDWRNLDRIHELIDPDLDSLVDELYEHILGVDHLRHLLAGPGTLERLHLRLRDYLASLGRNATALDYFEERLHIGFVHEGIGLELRWYLGIYPMITAWICDRVASRESAEPHECGALMSSLHRVVALDLLLAVETYHHASNQRLEDVLVEQYLVENDLRRTTARDGLTGIMNRQVLLESIEVEFLRSRRFSYQFALLLLDVDAFKQINDSHGHRFGDFVLRRVVELIQIVLRPEDIVGRYGGDEILIGLPGCSIDEAFRVAERIRLKVKLTRIERGGSCAPASVSIGVTSLHPSIESPAQLFDHADEALYRSKRAGRNRTTIWEEQSTTDPDAAMSEQSDGE
jgi:diguanylate cyclase (GGDEF)-like protein